MYACVTTIRLGAEGAGDLASRWQEEVLPVAQRTSGFVRAYFLVDDSGETALSVGVAEERDAFAGADFQSAVERFAGSLGQPPEVRVYELRAQSE